MGWHWCKFGRYYVCTPNCRGGPCPSARLLIAPIEEFPDADVFAQARETVDGINAQLEQLADALRERGFSLSLFSEEVPVKPQQDDDPNTIDFIVLHPISVGPPPPGPDDGQGKEPGVDVTLESLRLFPPGQ